MKKKILILIFAIILIFLIYLIISKNIPIAYVRGSFIPLKHYLSHKVAIDYLKKQADPKILNEIKDEKTIKDAIVKKLIDSKIFEKEVKKLNLQNDVEKKVNDYLDGIDEKTILEIQYSYGMSFENFKNFIIKPFFEYEVLKEKNVNIDELTKKKNFDIIIFPWINLIH
jgi:hypothetical protein